MSVVHQEKSLGCFPQYRGIDTGYTIALMLILYRATSSQSDVFTERRLHRATSSQSDVFTERRLHRATSSQIDV